MSARETLSSRLGFLLISAGCAIGLGNVWRFPWMAGHYGGAWFVLTYLFFLVALGLPILLCEFAMGRASKRNMGRAFHVLEPQGSRWHFFGWFSLVGSYLLMMFYIPVAGWMVAYCYYSVAGMLSGLSPDRIGAFFGGMLSDPAGMTSWAWLVLLLSLWVCALGVRAGLERVVKVMMVCLLFLMLGLAIHSMALEGGEAGISFYLVPDWARLKEAGVLEMVSGAMSQAFFTLGLGIGSMMIFASYLDDRRTLTGESLYIAGLDTFVALTAGLIIFPACFAYNVEPNAGPGLIFITLPNVFNSMEGGRLWGSLFFIFMGFAALTTVITVVENIVSYSMDAWGWTRRKSSVFHAVGLAVMVLPCILGFNLWGDFAPLGSGTCVLDLEDFILSNNLLPIGAIAMMLFCTRRYGWGWDAFVAEMDKGEGVKFPRWARFYVMWIVPAVVLFLFLQGYAQKFLG